MKKKERGFGLHYNSIKTSLEAIEIIKEKNDCTAVTAKMIKSYREETRLDSEKPYCQAVQTLKRNGVLNSDEVIQTGEAHFYSRDMKAVQRFIKLGIITEKEANKIMDKLPQYFDGSVQAYTAPSWNKFAASEILRFSDKLNSLAENEKRGNGKR